MINSYSSIGEIQSLVRSLDPKLRNMFENVFDVNVYSGVSVPSSQIEPSILHEFGSIEAVRSQRIVKIVNKVTSNSATYNPLFDVRITSEKGLIDSVEEANFSNDTIGGLLAHTVPGSISDPFDRVIGEHSVVTGTLLKADVYHGLLIPSGSGVTHFNNDVLTDYLRTSWRWIRTAHDYDKAAVYPLIVWNARVSDALGQGYPLEPIGLFLGKGKHYAAIERDRQAASLYRDGVYDYYHDLFLIHEALGLGYSSCDTKTFVDLTPSHSGSEVVVLSQNISDSVFDEVYHAFCMFRDQFTSAEFHFAMTSPPLGSSDENWLGFPSVCRFVVPDGIIASRFGFNGMDLFGQSVITRDPFVVARALLSN
jgi:hypothetical protein